MCRDFINYLKVLTEYTLTEASASVSERQQHMLISPQTLVIHVTKEDI